MNNKVNLARHDSENLLARLDTKRTESRTKFLIMSSDQSKSEDDGLTIPDFRKVLQES